MQQEPKIDEVENEAKSLLSERDYEKLSLYFKTTPKQEILLKNSYFDTLIGNKIRNTQPAGTTLRVREEEKKPSILQLKFPIKKGTINEYKDNLYDKSYMDLFFEGIIPRGNVRMKLEQLGIMELYKDLGSATTYRVQVVTKWTDAKVFLDHVIYPDNTFDHELEVESDHFDYSEKILIDILEVFSIERTPADSKFERFLRHYTHAINLVAGE